MRVALVLAAVALASPGASQAQVAQASLDQLAANPVVTVQISEQLRTTPDEVTIVASTESRAPTATAAL